MLNLRTPLKPVMLAGKLISRVAGSHPVKSLDRDLTRESKCIVLFRGRSGLGDNCSGLAAFAASDLRLGPAIQQAS